MIRTASTIEKIIVLISLSEFLKYSIILKIEPESGSDIIKKATASEEYS
jgi:hypothetical protein